MEDRKNKYFTLLLIADEKSRIRKYRITYNFLRSLFVVAAIVIAAVVILTTNLFLTRQKLDEKVAELERVEYKIAYTEIELANLEKKTQDIETKTKILENYFKEVEELDKMVRSITGEGGYAEEVAIYTSDLSADIDIAEDPNEVFYYTDDQEQGLDDIDLLLDKLLETAPELSEVLSKDMENMEDHIYLMEHTPDIWPTWGRVTSNYNERRWGRAHKGIDIANNYGVPVNASASGIVIYADWNGSYGRKVIIFHGFGYSTVYAHLNRIYVKEGEEVVKGQAIGEVGNSGRSTGPHLHYEVLKEGIPQNPRDFLP